MNKISNNMKKPATILKNTQKKKNQQINLSSRINKKTFLKKVRLV